MKKLLFLTVFFWGMFSFLSQAQISEGGIPQSFKLNLSLKNVDFLNLPVPDLKQVYKEDDEIWEQQGQFRYAVSVPVDANLNNSGTWTELPNNQGRIWQLHLKSAGSLATGIYYNDFYLPIGARLFIYDPNHKYVLGAYTYKNNPENGLFANEMIPGDEVILELYLPSRLTGTPRLSISEISYAYKNTGFIAEKGIQASDYCEVNVNCSPEGDNWQDEKRGVARLSIKIGSNYYLCSGSLVNNTAQDCTPYLLTADHCGDGASASDFNQWIFYFNYEASTCSGTTGPTTNTVTGCTKKAEAANNVGTTSDMLLLELNSSPPSSYNVYYNGWDRTNNASPSGVSIHHPAGDIKKISTYTSSLSNYYNTHWLVYWASTANGHGVTEGGSSGSPIFNSSGLIVGTLTGGASACDVDGAGSGTGPDQPDIYGKVYYHWDQNGSTSAEQLSPWLDPNNNGVTQLSGMNCGSNPPVANFTADQTTVVVGSQVNFTDLSTNAPTSWSWSFNGGTPTSSSTQNPSVTYNTLGDYDVSLTVSNAYGSDTETKNLYIHVVDQLTTCDTLNYPLAGTPTIYASSGGGYVSGNNDYGDLAKANYFSQPSGYDEISSAYFWFYTATNSGSTQNVNFKIWADNSGTVGNVLANKYVALSDIVSDVSSNYITHVIFDTPVAITGPFYVGVELPQSAGDTLALVSNTDGDTNPGTAWEQWSDNSWYPFSSSSAWGMNLALAIFPVVCPSGTGNSILTTETNDYLGIFPNPNNGHFDVTYISNNVEEFTLNLISIDGRIIYSEKITKTSPLFRKDFDFRKYPKGIYSLQIISNNGIFNSKLVIQ